MRDSDVQTAHGPTLLTIREAAAELRLSERSIANLLADGRLPSIKLGRARRIRRTDLEKLIAASAVVSAAPSSTGGEA